MRKLANVDTKGDLMQNEKCKVKSEKDSRWQKD